MIRGRKRTIATTTGEPRLVTLNHTTILFHHQETPAVNSSPTGFGEVATQWQLFSQLKPIQPLRTVGGQQVLHRLSAYVSLRENDHHQQVCIPLASQLISDWYSEIIPRIKYV